MVNSDSVLILLCTYKPNLQYFEELIESIDHQTHKNIFLSLHDDGSSIEVLHKMENILEKSNLSFSVEVNKSNLGHAKNFIHNLIKMDEKYDYYAYCDQDDIWHKNKIKAALEKLDKKGNAPAMYCCRSRLVDHNGELIGTSPIKLDKPSFKNSLVQSIAAGNTMVINKESFLVLKKTSNDINITAHDWWTYILLSSVGGYILFDHSINIDYRLHSNNAVGTSFSFTSKLKRLKQLTQGKYREWNDMNLKALDKSLNYLTEENKKVFSSFCKLRQSNFMSRNIKLYKLGISRHSLLQTIILHLAVLFNRV